MPMSPAEGGATTTLPVSPHSTPSPDSHLRTHRHPARTCTDTYYQPVPTAAPLPSKTYCGSQFQSPTTAPASGGVESQGHIISYECGLTGWGHMNSGPLLASGGWEHSYTLSRCPAGAACSLSSLGTSLCKWPLPWQHGGRIAGKWEHGMDSQGPALNNTVLLLAHSVHSRRP